MDRVVFVGHLFSVVNMRDLSSVMNVGASVLTTASDPSFASPVGKSEKPDPHGDALHGNSAPATRRLPEGSPGQGTRENELRATGDSPRGVATNGLLMRWE